MKVAGKSTCASLPVQTAERAVKSSWERQVRFEELRFSSEWENVLHRFTGVLEVCSVCLDGCVARWEEVGSEQPFVETTTDRKGKRGLSPSVYRGLLRQNCTLESFLNNAPPHPPFIASTPLILNRG